MKDRKGGYTRILKMGYRQGDAADVVILELVDYKLPDPDAKEDKPAKSAEKKAPAKKAPAKKAKAAEKAEAPKE